MSTLEELTAAADAADAVTKAAEAKVAAAEKECTDAAAAYDGSERHADRREQLETVLRRAKWDLDLAKKREDTAIDALNVEQDKVWAAEAAELRELASEARFLERAKPILDRFVERDNAARRDAGELQQLARAQAVASIREMEIEGLRGRKLEVPRPKNLTLLQSYVGVSIFLNREGHDSPTGGARCIDSWISGFTRPAWNGTNRDQWNLIERIVKSLKGTTTNDEPSNSDDNNNELSPHAADPRDGSLDESREGSTGLHCA